MNVILAATEQQKEDAFEVRKLVFVEEQKVPEEEEIDQYEETSVHFVMYHEGIPVGAGRFRSVDGVGKLERICVHAAQRGKGAGVLMMDAMEKYAASKGFSTLKLNAQVHAIPFYERLGFTVTSDEFMDAGILHKSMQKNLV
ncbi:GNAT family N-acetyltransferase [Jeotgalibacillus soli]|uniref:N-acetyltransferase domain-containing protein n=1 Tax=Jeotgalibacillus soli TaxID=889306 RepID=A0A0C2R635_9BACL|nr:GNAT family N-acetyltransferase [Jeotgalibacillus soli]KIL45720.1 hypothetical protein KP78_20690 [Jeotgalibacillus soli]